MHTYRLVFTRTYIDTHALYKLFHTTKSCLLLLVFVDICCLMFYFYKSDKPGPVPATTGDFWRMIWEQDVGKIVMLANVFEAGKVTFTELFFH